MDADYEPGTCNIGPDQRRKRWLFGVAALLIASVLAATELPSGVKAPALFVSLLFGFEGVYQGYIGFCTGFAHRGVYDVSASGGEVRAVEDAAARRADRRQALRLHAAAVFSAVFTTAVMVAI